LFACKKAVFVKSKELADPENNELSSCSLAPAFNLAAKIKAFIIGGGEIYNQTIGMTDTIYRTVVNTEIDGDVYFSEINPDEFNLVWEEKHEADEKNKFDYTYQKFERISLL
jgi:dihydrofolate reductase